MATMNHRSTYALDRPTALRIRELARRWNVSQAEVIRRSVRLAATQAAEDTASLTPQDVVDHYRKQPPRRSWTEARRLVARLRAERRADDEERLRRLYPQE